MQAEYNYEFSRAAYDAHKTEHMRLLADFQKRLIDKEHVTKLVQFAESALALSEFSSRFGFVEHENGSYRFYEYWHFRLLSAIEFDVDWEPIGRTPLDTEVAQILLKDESFVASCVKILNETQNIDLSPSQIYSLFTPINVVSNALLSLDNKNRNKEREISELTGAHTLLNRLIATWQHPIAAAGVDFDSQLQEGQSSFLEADVNNWSFQLELPRQSRLIRVVHRVSESVLSGQALFKLLSNSANDLPAVGELADELDRIAA